MPAIDGRSNALVGVKKRIPSEEFRACGNTLSERRSNWLKNNHYTKYGVKNRDVKDKRKLIGFCVRSGEKELFKKAAKVYSWNTGKEVGWMVFVRDTAIKEANRLLSEGRKLDF